jgi:hypothetical protein
MNERRVSFLAGIIAGAAMLGISILLSAIGAPFFVAAIINIVILAIGERLIGVNP